jgi:hypothetical protein
MITKRSLVRKLPSYGRMSMVSLVIMSTTEAATIVRVWGQSPTLRERVHHR